MLGCRDGELAVVAVAAVHHNLLGLSLDTT